VDGQTFKKRVGRVRQCRNPAKKNIPQFDRKAGLRLTTNPAYKPICIFYTTVGSASVQLLIICGNCVLPPKRKEEWISDLFSNSPNLKLFQEALQH